MTENMMRFLESISKNDEAFIKRLNESDADGVIALAREKGFTLTPADLEDTEPEGEVALEEADAVAGGKQCVCVLGGGGEAGGRRDLVCACTGCGTGFGRDDEDLSQHFTRCWCVAGGHGYNANKLDS